MSTAGRRVVYLVRHGRTALNADGRLRGHLDPPLDDLGSCEVDQLGQAFASLTERPAGVVSGPLSRTRETAAAIALPCGLDSDVDPRLVDRDYGPWAGEDAEEVRTRFGPDLADLPGAETLSAILERSRAVLDELVHRPPRGPVVLVAHDVVNRLVLRALDPDLGPLHLIEQRTACWNAIELGPTGWRVRVVDGDAQSLRASDGLSVPDAGGIAE